MSFGISMIDPTITIGNIIEISTIVIGGIIVFAHVKSRVDNIGDDVAEMRIDMRSMSKSVNEISVVNNRLGRCEQDIFELRRGRGFIQDEIRGEYPRS